MVRRTPPVEHPADRPHRIRVRTSAPRELAAALVARAGVQGVAIEAPTATRAGAVLVETTDVGGFRRSVAVTARDLGATLLEVTPLDDDLDSVFRYLVQP